MPKHEDDIDKSIRKILGTAKGERDMQPNFGCNIHDYIFEVINDTTINKIESNIREILTKWEPRIEILHIEISSREVDQGKLVISVDYLIRTTNDMKQFIFDFNFTES